MLASYLNIFKLGRDKTGMGSIRFRVDYGIKDI
jgi:hypothetical protein